MSHYGQQDYGLGSAFAPEMRRMPGLECMGGQNNVRVYRFVKT